MVACFECVIENDALSNTESVIYIYRVSFILHSFAIGMDLTLDLKGLMQLQFTAECFTIFMMHVPHLAA